MQIWNLIWCLFHKVRYCRKLESQSSSSKWKKKRKSVRSSLLVTAGKLSYMESLRIFFTHLRLKRNSAISFLSSFKTSTLRNNPRLSSIQRRVQDLFFTASMYRKFFLLSSTKKISNSALREESTGLLYSTTSVPLCLDFWSRNWITSGKHARTPSPPGTLCRSRHRHCSSRARLLHLPRFGRTVLWHRRRDVVAASTERVRRYFVGFIVRRRVTKQRRRLRALWSCEEAAKQKEPRYLLSAPSDASPLLFSKNFLLP